MERGSDKIIIIIVIVIIIRSHVAQAEDSVVFVVLCAVSVLLSTSLGIESDTVLTSWLNSGSAQVRRVVSLPANDIIICLQGSSNSHQLCSSMASRKLMPV